MNTDLAVCLLTCGVQPYWDSPIMKNVDESGEEKIYFHLERTSPDGEIVCNQSVQWWSDGTDFIEKNQEHPFAIAMAALMNKKSFLETIKRKTPTVKYVLEDGPTVYVTKGTKRQLALKEKYGY